MFLGYFIIYGWGVIGELCYWFYVMGGFVDFVWEFFIGLVGWKYIVVGWYDCDVGFVYEFEGVFVILIVGSKIMSKIVIGKIVLVGWLCF